MNRLTRRTFIKRSALLGATPFILPRLGFCQSESPAKARVNIALIGAGGVAEQAYNGLKNENIVALCDISAGAIGNAKTTKPYLEKAAEFSDFRVMFDKMGKDIDAVVISTPDHTHFPATMEAMQRGKHVYTQKPLTHNIWEARTLRKAAEKYKVVTIMGNQGHTNDGLRDIREWYEAGLLGQVSSIHSVSQGPDWKSKYFKKPAAYPPPQEPVPGGIDWDCWLGPVPQVPYNPIYQPLTWRGFWEFGTGMLGDWFCHTCDAPVWTLDLYNPVRVEAVKITGPNEGMCPDGSVIRWDFPARGDKIPCSLWWYDGGNQADLPPEWSWSSSEQENSGSNNRKLAVGTLWMGDKGVYYTDARSNHPRHANRERMMELKAANAFPPAKYPRVKGGPFREWMAAIRGEGPQPGSNFDYASRLTEVALLGVLALRFGGIVEWDSDNMKATNRPELNAFIKEPVRKGWDYGDALWKA